MKKRSGLYPRVGVDAAGSGVVSQAGGVTLVETLRVSGLDAGLSRALARWRKPTATHDPAKVVCDLALSLAVGGDCLADVAVLRAEPGVYGPVASDPTVSRTIDALAGDASRVLAAINAARAQARAHVWGLAGQHAPDHGADADRPLVVDVDATLVTAHSEKEQAAPTFKRGFGFHPLWAFVDHGPEGTGEPLAVLLRPGNAGSNTAADHIGVIRDALRQLPSHRPGVRPGRRVLIRTDAAGATHDVLDWLVSRRLSYSVGFTLPEDTERLLRRIPTSVWAPAYDADREVRDGAWVAELTGLLDLSGWPKGMRVIARKERPHPGAQLRITDIDGMRVTAFATNTRPGGPGTQLADLELRAPPPGPRRGPHPLREGHRADQPAPSRLRPEPDLVRHRRVGLRAHRVAADPRPGRAPGPPLGTQTATAAAVLHRRAPRRLRPPRGATPGPHQPLGRPDRRHAGPAARPAHPRRLTPGSHVPTTLATPRPRGTRRPTERHRTTRHTRQAESPSSQPQHGQSGNIGRLTKDPG